MRRELLQSPQRPQRYLGSYLKERRRASQASVTPRPTMLPEEDFLKEAPLPPVELKDLWRRRSKKTRQASGPGSQVEITVSLPKASLPRLHLADKTKRAVRKATVAAGCLSVLALGLMLGIHQLSHRKPGVSTTSKAAGQRAVAAAHSEQTPSSPTYAVLLPAGKTIDQLGGWTRVSPPDKDPAYAFADTVAGTAVTVSEQPLPKTFQANPATSLATLADQFSAKEKVSLADGSAAYVGSSAKGPQSALAIKADTLLLLKSANTISASEWGHYINSLQ